MNSFITYILTGFFLLTQSVTTVEWTKVSEGNKFPEGPAWNSSKNELYVSNCYANWITRIKDDKADTLLLADSINYIATNGMTVGPDGYLYACDFGLGAIIRIKDGKAEKFIPGYGGERLHKPNDITFDKNGNLYFSEPNSYDKNIPDGRVFFYNFKTKQLIKVADSITFPNGLGISPVDGRLYLSESVQSRVLSFRVNEDGTLSDKRVFIELPGGDPDGMNFDEMGNMFLAHFGSGTIFVIAPEGQILKRIKAPGMKPSNVEFGGPNGEYLFITEDETNSVYRTELSQIGLNK
ncbi:MAG: hypothetical protein D6830_01010 [Ignavibacteria bacterium]|nr:MAG: hypothetical protein D6830_01010 [Ignavibacteria bacterium]